MKKAVFQWFLAALPIFVLCLGYSLPLHAQLNKGIEIGIIPYLPTATILERYQPLRAYLEQHMREPVNIVTAPDYASFIERTQRGEYPFVITVAHAARLAEVEAGYQPMLRPGWDTYVLLRVKKDSAVQDIKELRGKTIATPGPYAIVSQLGANWLRQVGLKPGEDVILQPNRTHTTSLHAVTEGAVDAGFISNRAFVAVKSDLKDSVRSLGQYKESGGPGVVYMAHPSMPKPRLAEINAAILAFVRTAPGKVFVANLGYDTLREIRPGELAVLDPFVRELRQVIAANKPAKP